jgi:transposase
MKREEILALCASNPEVIAYILSLESQIKELTERLIVLESRLNQNSRNSSKPPSTDFVKEKPNPRSRREKSDRKPGGQEGHPGTTLDMVNDPD